MTSKHILALTEAEEGKPEGLTSKLAKAAFARLETGNLKGRRREFLKNLDPNSAAAVAFTQLVGQVNNGGFLQWIDNRYAEEGGDLVYEWCNNSGNPVLQELRDLLSNLISTFNLEGYEAPFQIIREKVDESSNLEEKLAEAISQQDWDTADEILGGSDLGERKFSETCDNLVAEGVYEVFKIKKPDEEILHDEINADLEGDNPPPNPDPVPAPKSKLWTWKLIDGSGDTIYYSKLRFLTEEEAEDDASEKASLLTYDDLSAEGQEKIEQTAVEDLTQKYVRELSTPADDLDNLDDDFYDIGGDNIIAALDAEFEANGATEQPAGEPAVPAPEPDLEPESVRPAPPVRPPNYSPGQGDEDFRRESISQAVRRLI